MLTIQNDVIRLSLLPEFGGRITELIDLRSGRNWLVPGPAEGSPAQDAGFGVQQARGWDECFPSGASCEVAPWPMRLRDHGEFWGRPAQARADADSITVTAQAGPAIFQRTCQLFGTEVELRYHIENTGPAPLPWLWGQHMLLNLHPGEVIDLPGITRMEAAFLSHQGRLLGTGPLTFPRPDDPGLPNLGRVHPLETGFAAKLFARVQGAFAARLGGADGQIEIAWHGDEIGHLGLWLDHGGWPEDAPITQVCLAPSTAPFENLSCAVATAAARLLEPGGQCDWTVRLRLLA